MMSGPEASPAKAAVADSPAQKPGKTQRLWRWLAIVVAVGVLLVALALFNNNFAVTHPSRAEFQAQLDNSYNKSIEWIVAHPVVVGYTPPLLYMVADIAKMSGDPRLGPVLAANQRALDKMFPPRPLDPFWARYINPQAPLPTWMPGSVLETQSFDLRWHAYAIAPDHVGLSAQDKANLFDRYKYVWGARHHQQLALIMYRQYQGASEDLNGTINYLSEKQARDEHLDFRLTDGYIQRVAFDLASGRPDLIRPRWVERIMAAQNPDGSWNYYWHGWGAGLLEFGGTYLFPGHTTVQGAWAMAQLKFRYPQWIAENYH